MSNTGEVTILSCWQYGQQHTPFPVGVVFNGHTNVHLMEDDFVIKKCVAFAQGMNGVQAEDISLQSHSREDWELKQY